MQIDRSHDSFQKLSDDPFWSESAYFPFLVPDKLLSGWVYILHRRNMGHTVAGVAIWDPTGDATYDCRYYDWGDPLPIAPDADMFDFALSNGLRVECVEPLSRFHLTYHNSSCELDLQWEATDQPYVADWAANSGSDDWAKGHYEQRGRIRGRLVLGDEVVPVDSWSNRDRSWGARHYVNNPGGDFPWGIAADGSGFHALALDTRPRAADGLSDEPFVVRFGWYEREAERDDLVSGTRRVLERGDDGRPLRVVVAAVDRNGRELVAEGRCVNWLKWTGYATMFQWWCLVEWDFDGKTGWGEVMEFCPLEQGRKFLRAHRDRRATGNG
jgi:hypothetical protein